MAVHSVADSMGLFVKMADEAINIGPAPARSFKDFVIIGPPQLWTCLCKVRIELEQHRTGQVSKQLRTCQVSKRPGQHFPVP